MFNFGVQRLMVPGINDTQCGFKMFTAAAVEAIFPLVQVDGWAFDIEVLHLARARGLRIVEVPIEWHYRRESRLSLLRDGAGMVRELLAIRARARRRAAAGHDVEVTDRRAAPAQRPGWDLALVGGLSSAITHRNFWRLANAPAPR